MYLSIYGKEGAWRRKASHTEIIFYMSGVWSFALALKMVCREVLNSRAMALILTPDLIRSNTTCFCSSFNTGGRPKRFPAPRALLSRNECVQVKVSFKFSDCWNYLHHHFPVGLVRSMPANAKQCTLIPVSVSCSTVFLISIALQPRRSSFVTINWSPHFRRASNRLKPDAHWLLLSR